MSNVMCVRIRRPPRSTLTDTLLPDTTLFRSAVRLAVLEAPGEGIRREAAEHHRVDRADARAGQHGIGGFRNHRHVDGDAVALLDAARLQGLGDAADVLEEHTTGDWLLLGGAVALPAVRPGDRRGGTECVRTFRSRWSPWT